MYLHQNLKIMVTLTLTLDLDESLVSAYRHAKKTEKEALKKKIENLFALQWRKQQADTLHKQRVETLIQSMDELGREADANDLTEEVLDEILM
jgi:hypothetical protein